MNKSKRAGDLPLFGRLPKHAEWRLLERFALDLESFIDRNDLKVIRDICQKQDFDRYLQLDEYWGLHSIDPGKQPVGTRDACLYALSSLLQKQAWSTDITDAQKNAALTKFHSYEARMRAFNRTDHRLLTWSNESHVNLWLQRMQDFIANVLGDFSFTKVFRYCKHGPGGTFGLTSQKGHRFYKYATAPYEVTSDALPFAREFIKHDTRWTRALYEHPISGSLLGSFPADEVLFRVVTGNRIEFVPKKTDEARTIALEATMNVLLQLGVDGHIRAKLKKIGIDINDQSINQSLARLGSIDNLLDTLDLKGASDNIAIVIIEKLFPLKWANYLLAIRSDTGTLPNGEVVYYEKLSSMGNGFTFAVETLLFAAAVFAVNPEVKFGKNAHVYGDDIICPSHNTSELIVLLNLCGFLVNEEKSFFKSSYTRESCGADYYKGENIRPTFLKVPLADLDVFAFYSLHNRLAEWYSRIICEPWQNVTPEEEPLCLHLLRSWCDGKWLLYGPPDLEEQSAYLAVPQPQLGRTPGGLYRHDRVVAVVKQYDSSYSTQYFNLLCHEINTSIDRWHPMTRSAQRPWEDKPVGGSQFCITRRASYKYGVRRGEGRKFAWPSHTHESLTRP